MLLEVIDERADSLAISSPTVKRLDLIFAPECRNSWSEKIPAFPCASGFALFPLAASPITALVRRLHHTLIWLSFLLLVITPSTTTAAVVTRTIDDEKGDSVSGAVPVYAPINQFSQNSGCSGCIYHPDASDAFDQTWHDSSQIDSTPSTVTFSFTGTSVTIYCILVNQQSSATSIGPTSLVLSIDGASAGTYQHSPDGSEAFTYNVPVFNVPGLSNTEHSVVLSTNAVDSILLFDYASYEFDDGTSTTTTSSAVTETQTDTVVTTTTAQGSAGSSSGSSASTTGTAGSHSSSAPAGSSAGTSTSPTSGSNVNAGSPANVVPSSSGSASASASAAAELTASTSSKSSHTSVIVGILVAFIVILAAILAVVLCRRRRARQRRMLMADALPSPSDREEPRPSFVGFGAAAAAGGPAEKAPFVYGYHGQNGSQADSWAPESPGTTSESPSDDQPTTVTMTTATGATGQRTSYAPSFQTLYHGPPPITPPPGYYEPPPVPNLKSLPIRPQDSAV
uniref:Uncharacterized protein n=1 Tax=Mycena chlorophos TaxID=658473 RepID=A0ABQ0LRB6_MYCCL|nr:predicted protein [Mycena chlorophos]